MASSDSISASDEVRLGALFVQRFGTPPAVVAPLRAHGSSRRLHRLASASASVVGVVNTDRAENRAFVSFSRHFRAAGLPVPEIVAVADDGESYLEEDLGDLTLFELLGREREKTGSGNAVPEAVAALYEQVVRWLPEFQVRAGRTIDDSVCHPRARFDRQSMMWDLNYFKYHFLKLVQVPFDEQALENDFNALVTFLLAAPAEFFLYRDFQSRNVMVRDGRPWFIDYQGGRRGALHYDLASLLVDAKANLPLEFRAHLIDVYLDALARQLPVDRAGFLAHFDGFLLIRLLQAMGAYGFRGFYERKTHFLQSVPFALRNLEHFLDSSLLPARLPELSVVLQRIVRSTQLRELAPAPAVVPLTVRVESFSYKRGYPADESGHGGGFVFDCRALPNPGREARFASLAGDEAPVVAWLETHAEVGEFLGHVSELVDLAVKRYARRNFSHLSVAFGCTGGQHRSVFCATRFAVHLRQHAGVQVVLHHRDVVRSAPSAALGETHAG